MKRLAGATLLMTGSSLGGLSLSFLTQIYLASQFGAGAEMDAYLAATTLPTLIVAVVVASLSVVFIPVFVEYEDRQAPKQAWYAASSVLNLSLTALSGLTALGWLLSSDLMAWSVPGLPPATRNLSVGLLRWLWPTVALNALSTLLAGLYQAEHRFLATALAPVVGAGTTLGLAVLFSPQWGIQAVAMATLVGQIVQALCLSPILFERGHYQWAWDVGHAAVRSVLVLLTPLVLSSLIYRATPLVDRYVASHLPAGSISYLGYANRLILVLNTLFVSGLATTLFPSMAREAAAQDFQKLRQTVVMGQRLLMTFLFPALALLWALREPGLTLLFQRGQFTVQDTRAVGDILAWYLLALVGGALGTLLGRVYYVLKDTRTPAILGLLEIVGYALYLPPLARLYGAVGVAMANAIYLDVAWLVGGVIVFRKLEARGSSGLTSATLRLGLISLIAGGAAYGISVWLRAMPFLALISGGLAGTAFYLAALYIFRMPELVWMGSWLQSSRLGKPMRWLLNPLLARDETGYGS